MPANDPTPGEGESPSVAPEVRETVRRRCVEFEIEIVGSDAFELAGRTDDLDDGDLVGELTELRQHVAVIEEMVEEGLD